MAGVVRPRRLLVLPRLGGQLVRAVLALVLTGAALVWLYPAGAVLVVLAVFLATQISVSIDDFKVPKPTRFFTGASGSQSPIFNVQLPPGNLFEVDETVVPELVLSPSAEQGYYLFVRPLRPGTHTIRWLASGCTPGNSQDITYHLTVVGGGPKH